KNARSPVPASMYPMSGTVVSATLLPASALLHNPVVDCLVIGTIDQGGIVGDRETEVVTGVHANIGEPYPGIVPVTEHLVPVLHDRCPGRCRLEIIRKCRPEV